MALTKELVEEMIRWLGGDEADNDDDRLSVELCRFWLAHQWQDISTAPKGKPVLVHYKNAMGKGRTVKARYIERFTEESNNEDSCLGVDEFSEEHDASFYCEGWWEMLDNWEEYGFVKIYQGTPDKWQPLPEPPQ